MSDEDNIDTLILLNAVKEVSQDKLIDLVYSEKFNSFFKKNDLLSKMIPKSEKLADNSSLNKKWQESLIENILPNTYSSILSQSLRLKVIPFDENLTLQTDKAIEVNSYYIQDLQLSLETRGFTGSIDFVYPYQTEYDNKLMDIFTQGLPFQLEILIKQEFFIEEGQKEFIEKNGDLSNEEIKLTAYAGNSQASQTVLRSPRFGGKVNGLTKFDGLYKISFCDSMSFFWKHLNPVCLYSGESYNKIFIEQNTIFDKLVKLTFDKTSDPALKQKLAFICMNCQGDYNFYDYVQYILEQYGLLLIYNYKDEEYTITSDYKELLSKAKPVKSIFKEDKEKIVEIKHLHEKPYLVNKNIMNTNPNNADKQEIKPTGLDDAPKTIKAFQQDEVTQHDISNLFKLKSDSVQKIFTDKFAAKTIGLEIESLSFPCSYSIFPLQNNLTFTAKEWGLILDKKDKNMALHKINMKFEKTPLYSKNGKRHPLAYEDKQEGKIVKDKISFEFEDEAIKNSEHPLMFNCNSKLYLYNKEVWPKFDKPKRPNSLNIGGYIFTTKSDSDDSTYTGELFNYNAESSKSSAANENYNSSSRIACLDKNANTRPRYQVKVAPHLWTKLTPEGKQFVPADMVLPSYSNMLFFLKSGTEVELKLYEEYANLAKIKNYLAPHEMFTTGDKEQHQGIVFEDRKEQRTLIHNSYKPSDKTSSFKISHIPTTDNDSPSNLEMDNKSFKISVDCKK